MGLDNNGLEFSGLTTAEITPFLSGNGIDSPVDYFAKERLIERQIGAKTDCILELGTTGENPTLNKKESIKIVESTIEQVEGKAKIIVNIGTNATGETLDYLKAFEKIEGIDGYLLVNPYYNKPSQKGLQSHFTTVAQSTERPVILYNIPGRTGINAETETILRTIEEAPNIVGVKEASGNLKQMQDVIKRTPENFVVLSGDDGLTYPLIQMGGHGVVSVASNYMPSQMKEFVDACLTGDMKAESLHIYYQKLFESFFIGGNPSTIKAVLANKGIINEEMRSPVVPISDSKREQLLDVINMYNLDV